MTKYGQGFSIKRENSKKINLNGYLKKMLVVLVCALFVGSCGAYLFAVNTIASKGFEIKALEKMINVAKEDNEKLQLKVVEMTSMTDLQGRIQELGMVPVDQITYYDTAGQVVVRR